MPISSSTQTNHSNIICEINFENLEIQTFEANNTEYSKLVIKNCISLADFGDPSIPVYPVRLLIPQYKQVKDIQVVFSEPVKITYDFIEKPIMPEQEPFTFDKPANKPFRINKETYRSSSPINTVSFKRGETGYCKGFELLTVYLYPINYIPKNGDVRFFSSMTLKVSLEDRLSTLSNKEISPLRLTENDIKLVQSIVENPEDIDTYELPNMPLDGGGESPLEYTDGLCDPEDSYEFVIITSESLKDTTGYSYNWSDLVSHRQSHSGLSGTIVTVEEISSCTEYWNETSIFNDTQARIREFCKDAYQDWDTEYIILGGDWDGTSSHQIVPYRLFEDRYEAGTYDTMACDKYYSHLDGDWYYATEGIWGGGKNSGVNDFYGELYVGRICAYNAEMVSNAVNKIINYDSDPSLNDDWLSTATFCGGNLGWTSTSKQYMEELRLGTDTQRIFTGFEEWNAVNADNQIDTSERVYHADLGSSYYTSLKNSIEADASSVLNNLDHSNWNVPFGLSQWQNIHNTKPFLGYSQGCLAGRFHSGNAGCEQLICSYPERHAYALVLNTGYGYGSPSSTNGPSQYIHAYFWDYFFNIQSENTGNWQIGKAYRYASDQMGAIVNVKSSAWCYSWYSAHFFGDPSQLYRLDFGSNNAVVISSENPSDNADDVTITTSNLGVTISDPDNDVINWTIETSPDIGSNSGTNDADGTKNCNIQDLSYSTLYYWFVNASDGSVWTNETFSFTTEDFDNPIIFSNPSPNNSSEDISLYISSISITIQDPEGEAFYWSIETSPDIGQDASAGSANGSKTCSISNLQPSTTYTWFVNATDGNSWTRAWYTFTTRSLYSADVPANFSASAIDRFQIDLSWTDNESADSTMIEWHYTPDASWNIGDHYLLYNGTLEHCSHTGLVPGSTRHYKVWSWNATDNVWSNGVTATATTVENNAPVIVNPDPSNGSDNQELNLEWSVNILDFEGDIFDWTIECSNGQDNSGNGDDNGTKTLSLDDLDYSTDYYIWVNVTDSYDWSKEWFFFSTRDQSIPDPPDDFESVAYSRTRIDLSWLTDENSDTVHIRYDVDDYPVNRDSGIFLYNDSGNTKSLTGLDFGTRYYFRAWSWNITDCCWSVLSGDTNVRTDSNIYPDIGIPNIANGSINQPLSFSWNVTVSDFENDEISWSIECSNGQSNDSTADGNGIKEIFLINLEYNTSYKIWVNATDTYNWTKKWFSFTTRCEFQNYPVVISSADPDNESSSVSKSITSLSITMSDANNDTFNWSIETSPNIGSCYSNNDSNGSKTCDITNLEYSTTYYWYVNASDGNISTNESFWFVTEDEPEDPPPPSPPSPPSSPPSPPPYVPPPNIAPTADIGGPYSGFVNESITFNGSASEDADGLISEYNWDLGDGNTSSGAVAVHFYCFVGNYTITLSVTDNLGATGSETTYVIISEQEENDTFKNSTNQTDANDTAPMYQDDDNDGLPNEIEEELGSDSNSSNEVFDVKLGDDPGYIVDIDGDGICDIFYDPVLKVNSEIKHIENGQYLIDSDGDGEWDYRYDSVENAYSSYDQIPAEKTESNVEIDLLLPLVLLSAILICLTAVYYRYKIIIILLDHRLSNLNLKQNKNLLYDNKHHFLSGRGKIHFFTKSKNKKLTNEKNDEFE